MPLSIAPRGTTLKIMKTPVAEKVKRHLAHLGILVGAEITMLNEQAGDVIVKVKDCKLALNKQLATRIMVG
mgnify:FL=1